MDFLWFPELAAELKVQIIRKCHPIPYVRLRRACRHMDEICESHRNQLGIYCREKDSELSLVNCETWIDDRSYRWNPFQNLVSFFSYDVPYITVNSGKSPGCQNLSAVIWGRHLPEIRKSLSGFGYTSVVLQNSTERRFGRQDRRSNRRYERKSQKKYGEALASFLQITADCHIKKVTIKNLHRDQVEAVASAWKLDQLNIDCRHDLNEILKIEAVKKVKDIFIEMHRVDDELVQQAARDRDSIGLYLYSMTTETVQGYYRMIMRNEPAPRFLRLTFFTDQDYIEDYLFDWAPSDNYIGCYTAHYSRSKIKSDIWITRGQTTWRITDIRRSVSCYTDVDITMKTVAFGEELVLRLIEIFESICTGMALDYSVFYENMATLENWKEIKQQCDIMYQLILEFYWRFNPFLLESP